jgi:hypothetical protein
VGLGHFAARGRSSTVPLDLDYAQIVELRDGIAWRERDFIDWSESLAAVGLPADVLSRREQLAPGETLEL